VPAPEPQAASTQAASDPRGLRLILVRHAKSSWKDSALHDRQRPLNKRGKRDAPRMAKAIAGRGWAPHVVLCSDATRAMATWDGMADVFGWQSERCVVPHLYHASVDVFAVEVAMVPRFVRTLMVIGHNPGWDEVAAWCTGTPVQMTTCNALLMHAPGKTWSEAIEAVGTWVVDAHLQPKTLFVDDD